MAIYRGLPTILSPFSFALGVARRSASTCAGVQAKRMHWRQLVVLTEIVLLFAVGFFPAAWDIGANALVSFSCAMQVQAFRKVHGYPFASTMCIGNLRSGMDSLVDSGHPRQKRAVEGSALFRRDLRVCRRRGAWQRVLTAFAEKGIGLSCLLFSQSAF